jgi:hypothetical protein
MQGCPGLSIEDTAGIFSVISEFSLVGFGFDFFAALSLVVVDLVALRFYFYVFPVFCFVV